MQKTEDVDAFIASTPPAARIRDRLQSLSRDERLLKIALKLAEKRDSIPDLAKRGEVRHAS